MSCWQFIDQEHRSYPVELLCRTLDVSASLLSRLKMEELGSREWPVFRDLADVQQSVATYFDYYNHERRHSALAYQTPQAFYLQQLKNTALTSLA